MMGKHLDRVFILIFLAALYSCSRLSVDDSQHLIPIDFSVQDYTAEVKGGSLTTANISSFGVFALVNDSDESSQNQLMDNVKVTDKGNFWSADKMYYWPQKPGTTVDFYAYSPYSATPSDIGLEFSSVGITGMPSFEFTMSETADVDLMVAENEGCTAAGGPVSLTFKHLLCKVQFSFSVSDEGGFSYIVNSIKLNNIPNSAEYSWATDRFTVITTDNIVISAGDVGKDHLVNSTDPIVYDDFTVYLLPGSLSTVEITINNESPMTLDMTGLSLQTNKMLSIHFEITLTGIQFTTSIDEWKNGGVESGNLS